MKLIIKWVYSVLAFLIFHSSLCQTSVIEIFDGYDSLTIEIISEKENSTSNEISDETIKKWVKLSDFLSLKLENVLTARTDSILLKYQDNAIVLRNLVILLSTNDQFLVHPKMISIISKMDHYKTAFLINKLLRSLNSKVDYTNTLIDQLPESIQEARDSILIHSEQIVRDSIINTIHQKSDSIVRQIAELAEYDFIFVGPSLFVESTYGFNFFLDDGTIQQLYPSWPNRFSIMPELLYFSIGNERRYGASLYLGYSNSQSKVIPQVMIQFLSDKRSIESGSGSNTGLGFGLLFKNREWMTGLAYSSVSGGGIKLLIGL